MNLNQNLNFSDNIEKHDLPNGLKVIINPINSIQSASAGFFLKKGSRYESPLEEGYSHFAEHMIFKGTDKFDKKAIAYKFDKMGGYINAYTTHELVVLYNRVPFFYLEENIDLMYEIFNNSVFNKNEFDLEKEVILSEINADLEDPQEKVHEDFMKNLFPSNALGLPVIGNEKSIKNSTCEDLYEFYKMKFEVSGLLAVVTGKFDKNKILEQLKKFNFKFCPSDNILNKAVQEYNKTFMTILPSEQVHIILGTSKFDMDNEKYIKFSLLNLMLGESISSFLFQKIREDKGLCYSIYSFYNKYKMENVFGIYTSVLPKNVKKTYTAISEVIKHLKENGITEEELEHVKNQKLGEIILNHDLVQKEMQRIASMELTFGRIYSINEVIKMIKSTTVNDIKEMINEIFVKDNFITQILYKEKIKSGEWEF